MRDIKFRAWDIAKQKMVGWDWFKGKVLADVLENTEDYWILMQYIGLKDINNKEIYEGDILLLKDETYSDDYIVRYTKGHWEIHSEVDVNTELLEDWEGFCEVVGNIYEGSV